MAVHRLKHCHFSIVYNEIQTLRVKLPFLYEHFSQIIFYDLNVLTSPFKGSDDGSREFIQDFPDPEKKIVLITETNLNGIPPIGRGSIQKRQMFWLGSRFVAPIMDVFWCTDADEFFNESLIEKSENVLIENPEVNSIDLLHYVFWRSAKYILCNEKTDRFPFFPRIARHKSGQIYGHCDIETQYPKTYHMEDENMYHFSWIGDKKVREKITFYTQHCSASQKERLTNHYAKYLRDVWPMEIDDEKAKTIFNYPNMHPSPDKKNGIKIFQKDLPRWIK